MGDVRAQAILHSEDLVVANYATNSWAFHSSGTITDFTGLTTCLKDFYDDLATYWPSTMAQNGHQVKFYELPGLTPNYPVEETTFNLAANPTQTPFPSEVSLCLSFQGERVPGFPQARRRGRVYIGPLGSNASGTDARPSSTFINVLATAAATFKSNVEALTEPIEWAVWSPADSAAVNVDNGWVDNAWDTQRRRGIPYSSKTTFS